MVVARFVYADDAIVFAEWATEREPGRSLTVEDKQGFYNLTYENGMTNRRHFSK